MLRAHALELVDDRGQIRSRLEVEPGGVVLLQLFDRKGVIKVKLAAGEDGSSLETTQSGVQIVARPTGTSEMPKATSRKAEGAATPHENAWAGHASCYCRIVVESRRADRKGREVAMTKGLVLALCVIGLAGSASAKGALQMVGTVDNVRLQDDVLSFEFTGWITSGFASAPQNHPSYRWQNVEWRVKNLQIRITRWPTDDRDRVSIEDVAALAARLKETRHEASGSIDEPRYSASNTGQLLRIEGSKVYLVDRTRR